MSRIRRRVAEEGPAGIAERPRSGRPPVISARKRAQAVAITLGRPQAGLSQWTTRESEGNEEGCRAHVSSTLPRTRDDRIPGYETGSGRMLQAKIEEALKTPPLVNMTGKVDLIFTSPPFPLTRKKAYGNLNGDEYLDWMGKLAPKLGALLKPKGSLVMEIGNAWEEGQPTMSTLPLETLLEVKRKGKFHLCQQFICNNTARLPGPAQWVTVHRIRLKDSYTHVWWMSRDPQPKADNRNVLKPYSPRMLQLLKRQAYNAGRRPSGHMVSPEGFKKNHGGAIPSNVLDFPHPFSDPSFEQLLLDHHLHPSNVLNIPNTSWDPEFEGYLSANNLPRHPARMARGLVEFFIKLLTDAGDLVVDPFAGSNTTGAIAERLGRKWYAVEPTPEYVRGSKGRFPAKVVKEV